MEDELPGWTVRPCRDHADRERLVDLLIAYRAATRVDVYPTAWRLRLLLDGRVWAPEDDTRLWLDAHDRPLGGALLWRRRPDDDYLALEWAVDPPRATDDLASVMLAWAVQRAQAARAVTLYAGALDPRVCRAGVFAEHGFTLNPPDPAAHNVYFARGLADQLPEPALPAGFTLRPLHDPEEIEAYHAVYNFAPISAAHRRALLASDEYRHLVVVDPAGAFAAYGECSICRAEWALSGQRTGWIDYVETVSAYQRCGLGRAVLLSCLRQLHGWGATTARLITTSDNLASNRLYASTGFTPAATTESPAYVRSLSGA
jgi:GNAT superfamily N-acetyltransferase